MKETIHQTHDMNFDYVIKGVSFKAYKQAQARGSEKSVKKNHLESGHAAVACLLMFIRVESTIRRAFYYRYEKCKKQKAHDNNKLYDKLKVINQKVDEWPDVKGYVRELELIRDVISHAYIFRGEIEYDDEFDIIGFKEDGVSGKHTNTLKRTTEKLGIEIAPGQISFRDIAVFFAASSYILIASRLEMPGLRSWEWKKNLYLEPLEWFKCAMVELGYENDKTWNSLLGKIESAKDSNSQEDIQRMYTENVSTKLLIFGITGDLSRRKLLPALRQLVKTGEFEELEIIGVSRHEVDTDDLLKNATELKGRVNIFSMDLARAGDYVRLKKHLVLKKGEQLIVYLAVPPSAATQIVDFMGEAKLNTPNVKVLFEKPFGVDLVSAKDFIERTARYYHEDQLYRIDHYLAKEMAQNIVAFRGRNALFSNIWNNNFIERIEIVASEKIGIEGRGQFYEQTGALRDVVQGHLMQLLALTLMDIPTDFDWEQLPELRLKALEQLEPADPTRAFRAQYEGYQEEVGNIGSTTETFVSLELASTQPRWLDVPIRLVTGKALSTKTTEVRIHLKKLHEAQSNTIIFRIQPNEGIDMELFTKKPGYERAFETRRLALTFPEDTTFPDAYEQVLVDAIRSEKSLFASSGEVIRSWELLEPLQRAWGMDDSALPQYQPGSSDTAIS